MKYYLPVLLATLTCCLVQQVSAHEFFYHADLTGPGGATGTADILLDLDLVSMDVDTSFSGLLGTTTSANIHGLTASPLTGLAPVAIPLPTFATGLASGSSTDVVDLTTASSYAPAFVTASGGQIFQALNALGAGLDDSRMYIQINTNGPATGALSGFLVPVVPEPSSIGLLALACGVLVRRRGRVN